MSGRKVDPTALAQRDDRSATQSENPGDAVTAREKQIGESERLMAALLVLVAARGLSGSVRSVTGRETGEMGQQLVFRVAVLSVVRAGPSAVVI
jgi:hypothetical protein